MFLKLYFIANTCEYMGLDPQTWLRSPISASLGCDKDGITKPHLWLPSPATGWEPFQIPHNSEQSQGCSNLCPTAHSSKRSFLSPGIVNILLISSSLQPTGGCYLSYAEILWWIRGLTSIRMRNMPLFKMSLNIYVISAMLSGQKLTRWNLLYSKAIKDVREKWITDENPWCMIPRGLMKLKNKWAEEVEW